MTMIRQQFDNVQDEDDIQQQSESSFHGHFSENQGVFSIFLDLIEDIRSKMSNSKSSSACNCYVKSSKQLASYTIKSALPSDTVDTEDLPDVREVQDYL